MKRIRALVVGPAGAVALLGVLGAGGRGRVDPPGVDVRCELLAPGLRRASTRAMACLACHDGTVGAPIATGSPSHPVERSYAEGLAKGRARLRPFPRQELVLVDGTVVCATCHDGASPHPHHLAVPYVDLCTSCHDH